MPLTPTLSQGEMEPETIVSQVFTLAAQRAARASRPQQSGKLRGL